MAKNPFTPARQERILMKLLLFGDSGVGKTYLALTIPYGGKVALLDSERGSNYLAKNPAIPAFDVLKTVDYRDFTNALNFLSFDKHEYAAVVIDPISVLWNVIVAAGSDLDKVTTMRQWQIIKRKMDGIYRQIANLPIHVTVIARAKDEYANEEKVGVKADAEKTLAYLFDVVLQLGITKAGVRQAEVIKDRTDTFKKRYVDISPESFLPILDVSSQGEAHHGLDDHRAVSNLSYEMIQEESTPRPIAPPAPQLTPDQRVEKLGEWMRNESKNFKGDIHSIDHPAILEDLVAVFNDYDDAMRFFASMFQDDTESDARMAVIAKWLASDETRRNAAIQNWRVSSYGQVVSQ